jgi:peroxiredoxin
MVARQLPINHLDVPIEAGDPAPHFALPDTNGNLVGPADFVGRPVLLVFARHLY